MAVVKRFSKMHSTNNKRLRMPELKNDDHERGFSAKEAKKVEECLQNSNSIMDDVKGELCYHMSNFLNIISNSDYRLYKLKHTSLDLLMTTIVESTETVSIDQSREESSILVVSDEDVEEQEEVYVQSSQHEQNMTEAIDLIKDLNYLNQRQKVIKIVLPKILTNPEQIRFRKNFSIIILDSYNIKKIDFDRECLEKDVFVLLQDEKIVPKLIYKNKPVLINILVNLIQVVTFKAFFEAYKSKKLH